MPRTKAINCYDRATEINPSNIDALLNKASLYKELGMPKGAKECYRSISSRDILIDLLIALGGVILGFIFFWIGAIFWDRLGGILGFVAALIFFGIGLFLLHEAWFALKSRIGAFIRIV
ncbi:MAG: tetratricopeptide repeat protein [Proteobacteria bacterium]|nr:tetratricopeptide repeat protein [Pseudomonadota bacterium]